MTVSFDAGEHPRFVKKGILEDVSGESIGEFVRRHIAKGNDVRTDRFCSYGKALRGQQYSHQPERFEIKETLEHLKWLHRVVGNAKVFTPGTSLSLLSQLKRQNNF